MKTIGLTGGMGSGKSTVAGILSELGATVVNADLLGHAAYRRGAPGFDDVIRAFGDNVVGVDGEVDRKRLGAIVFSDPQRLAALNRLIWPRIREALQDRIDSERTGGAAPALVTEAAVLFEAGWEDLFDEVWVVTTSESTALQRLAARDHLTKATARGRLGAQMSSDARTQRADVIIENDGDLETLRRTVTRIWNTRVKGMA